MDTVEHFDDCSAMRSRTEIPQSCRCLAAGVLVFSVHTVMRERVSLNMQLEILMLDLFIFGILVQVSVN